MELPFNGGFSLNLSRMAGGVGARTGTGTIIGYSRSFLSHLAATVIHMMAFSPYPRARQAVVTNIISKGLHPARKQARAVAAEIIHHHIELVTAPTKPFQALLFTTSNMGIWRTTFARSTVSLSLSALALTLWRSAMAASMNPACALIAANAVSLQESS